MHAAYTERTRSPFFSSHTIDRVLVLIIPAAVLLFVEEANLEYKLFTVNASRVQISHSYRAPVSLNAEIKASWTAGLDVMEIWTLQIQKRCEGSWHKFVEDGDHCISNGHVLEFADILVHGVHIDDMRAADWCIDWQLGIDVQVFDSDLFTVVLHGCQSL